MSLIVDFHWDFHFHVCPVVFFARHSNYVLVGRPHFLKTGLKQQTKQNKTKKHHPPTSLLKDQWYEKLKKKFKQPNTGTGNTIMMLGV